MTQKDKKNIESAKDSLEDMLRRIGPFRPKVPKAKPTERKQWQVTTEGTFPPEPIHNRSVTSGNL